MINPLVYMEKVVRSFLRYQLTTYPFADERLNARMRKLLSLDETRATPLWSGTNLLDVVTLKTDADAKVAQFPAEWMKIRQNHPMR